MATRLRTTTIGSYPKPDYTPVPGWFSIREVHARNPTKTYSEFMRSRTPEAVALLDKATQEIVREQADLGIDIPSEGEVRREHYIYYHLRHVDGFDFEQLTEAAMRGGSWHAAVPTVRGPLGAGPAFLADDWRIAQAVTDQPVKLTVPGPLTILDSTANDHYATDKELAFALADALAVEIRRLTEAGCAWVQVDEPVFARRPQDALDFGVEALDRCFAGAAASANRAVHICCGYPSALDLEDYPKADPGTYFDIAAAIDASSIDAVSIEDAHRHNDLALLEAFADTTVILGVIAIARSRVEPVEEIRARLRAALDHIDADRLIAAPDCGLIMLDRPTTVAKLTNLVAAAHAV